KPWRLPHLRPKGVFWSTGKYELTVASAYELTRLEPTDCIEIGASSISTEANEAEKHAFAAYAPSASVEIVLSSRQADATIRAASSLSLADPDLNGRLVTQWSFSRGATHQLVGTLAAGWVVETVETSPADAMEEWFIDQHGKQRRIEIDLSRAASATQNVSVVITGRLQRFGLADPISAETMRMVAWGDARTVRHFLTFDSNGSYAIQPVGKLAQLTPEDLDDQDRVLLDQSTDSNLYDLTNADKLSGLRLTRRRGQYSANVDMTMTLDNGVLRSDYHLTITPASDPIDRLIVYSTKPLGDNVSWTNAASNTSLKAKKLAPADAQRAGLPAEGEAWLLRIAQPTSRPSEIIATIDIKPVSSERVFVPLLSLPEATEQRGRILVRCRDPNTLWLEPVRVQAMPLPFQPKNSSEVAGLSPVCAAYRYQPSDCRDPIRTPKLWASATSGLTTSPLLAQHIELESYFWPDGRAAHRAKYQLENHGATDLNVTLPNGARLATASLDGQSVDVPRPVRDGASMNIHLPRQEKVVNLSIYFESQGPALAAGSKLSPPLLLKQLPFLSGEWTVWLPEEYSAQGGGISNAPTKFNWRQRLFGPIGRPAEARPFNPFRLAEGASLINGVADDKVVEPQIEFTSEQSQENESGNDGVQPVVSRGGTTPPTAGWRKYRESFMSNGPMEVIVLHPPAISAWSAVLLLGFYLCGRWLRHRSGQIFATCVALAAAGALLLPTAYASLGAGATLGWLLSLMTDWPRRSIRTEESSAPRPVRTVIAGALAFFVTVGLTHFCSGQSPHAKTPARDSKTVTYRVLIPSDAKGHPVGTKYYVSEKFLRSLIAAGSQSATSAGKWILSDAAFSGELRNEPNRIAEIIAGNWAFRFSIETLARNVEVV
ncbi:MAG TPA: hypothetical protein VHE81_16825, partial [Lacipirellulaceae bacterium]|nr:hypothetical protein [Lacipirellulaceae bacterium]